MSIAISRKLSSKLAVPPSEFTAAREFASLSEVREWAQRNAQYFEKLRFRLPSPAAKDAALTMRQPFARIADAIERLDRAAPKAKESRNKDGPFVAEPTGDEIDHAMGRIAEILSELKQGATFTVASAVELRLKNARGDPFFEMGYLAAVFGFPLWGDDEAPDPEWLADEQQRARVVDGFTVGASSAAGARAPLTMKKEEMNVSIKRVNAALEDFQQHAAGLDKLAKNRLQTREAEADELDAQVAKLIRTKMREHTDVVRGHQAEMTRIRSDFKDHLALKDVSNYWDRRAKGNRLVAYMSAGAFAAAAVGLVWAMYRYGPLFLHQAQTAATSAGPEAFPFAFLAMIAVPVIVLLWVLRIPSRVFIEHLNIANDARHREKVITTYLSLLRDESAPVRPEERAYALAAIFGPSLGGAGGASTPSLFPFGGKGR